MACILSLYILSLLALPAVQVFADTSSEQVCCKQCKPAPSEEQNAQDNLPIESQESPYICNPFEVCAACIGFTVHSFPFFTSPSNHINELLTFHYSAPSSAYISSIFQPPRIG